MNEIFEKMQKLDIPKLIGKESTNQYSQDIEKIVKDKVILITGAAGSIGYALLKKILDFNPQKIIALDYCESGIFKLENRIKSKGLEEKVEVLLCNINHVNILNGIFKLYKPDFVIHAAAYKHVPIMEKNTIEAIQNNVMGTYHLIQLCEKYEAKKFLFISTDKAVNPICMMGATKRICEKMILSMKNSKNTIYMAVRFGNVIESSCSLTQIIKQQILNHEPITLTDKHMERYFMSMEEAVYLILLALNFNENSKIYILDMGQTIKIYDLTIKILEALHLKLNKDVFIKYIGIRPGEKIKEELSYSSEILKDTKYDKILKIEDTVQKPIFREIEKIKELLEQEDIQKEEIHKIINFIVPSYARKKEE